MDHSESSPKQDYDFVLDMKHSALETMTYALSTPGVRGRDEFSASTEGATGRSATVTRLARTTKVEWKIHEVWAL